MTVTEVVRRVRRVLLGGQIVSLHRDVDRLRSDLERLTSLQGRVVSMETGREEDSRRVSGIEQGLSLHESRLVRVERRATAYESGLASLSVELERRVSATPEDGEDAG